MSTIGFVMRLVMYVTARMASITAMQAESRTSRYTLRMESFVRLTSVWKNIAPITSPSVVVICRLSVIMGILPEVNLSELISISPLPIIIADASALRSASQSGSHFASFSSSRNITLPNAESMK